MKQLSEFAQHKNDFDRVNTRIVAVSVDDQQDAYKVWDKGIDRQFTILSDPGAAVIRQYGLLHARGKGTGDIAIRTTLLIDEQGRERWRRVSGSIPDIPSSEEALNHIRETE